MLQYKSEKYQVISNPPPILAQIGCEYRCTAWESNIKDIAQQWKAVVHKMVSSCKLGHY